MRGRGYEGLKVSVWEWVANGWMVSDPLESCCAGRERGDGVGSDLELHHFSLAFKVSRIV